MYEPRAHRADLRDRADDRYLVPDLRADIATAGNVVGKVFFRGGNFFYWRPGRDEGRRRDGDRRQHAERQKVFMKIGGLAMHMYGFDLRNRPKPPHSRVLAELWKIVEMSIEIFGSDRTTMESNFPLDKCSAAMRPI